MVTLTPEDLVPHEHPIRRIKPLAERVLQEFCWHPGGPPCHA